MHKIRLVDGVFQGLAGTEFRYFGFFDLDCFASARVAAGAGGAFGNGKGTESNKRYRALLFKGGFYGTDQRLEGAAGISLRQICLGSNVFDQLGRSAERRVGKECVRKCRYRW